MLSKALQLLLLTTIYTHAVKPPGYVEPDKPEDPNPPKYAYKYNIADAKENAEHGKEERRDGIHAEGRYYVQDKQYNQDVRYFADDWGYHSAIEYSSVGPHSKSNAKFALGSEAVQLLKNKENNLPQLQGLPNIGRLADGTTNQGVQPPNHFPTPPRPQDDPQTQSAQSIQPHLVAVQGIDDQGQQTRQRPELRQVLLIPNQADHVDYVDSQPVSVPHVTDNSLETTALFDSTAGQPLVTQFLHPRNQEESYLESFEKFGVKINDVKDQRSRLIENTRDLISGQDVLNINGAAATSNEEPNVETSTITISTESPQVTTVVTESSLKEQPIVVAESDEKTLSTTSKYEVTEKQVTESIDKSESDEVVVTPRPVSTNFLAPINAGIRLENGQHSKSQVEVMESIPYYLGKYEYPLEYAQKYGAANSTNIVVKATEDIELGKTLLFFPTIDFPKTTQQLPNVQTKHKFLENQQQQLVELHNHLDQELAQGYLQHVAVQPDQDIRKVHHGKEPCPQPSLHENPRPYPTFATKYIDRPYPVNLEKIHYVDRPVEKLVPYYIDRPYPVEVKVPSLRPVEKIIEKPVPQYINRPYPVEVKIPVPTLVPVEKIVEKPVPQYIDRPYRVEVKVPVEKIVERPVPHYIDRPYPVPVKVPVHVEKIVEKLVPQYINRPYPVEVKVPVPTLVPVEKIVEKPVPQYIDRPYPVKVPVPVAQHKVVEKPITGHYLDRPYQFHQFHIVPVITDVQAQKSDCHTQAAQHSQHQFQHFLNPYAYAPQYISSQKNGPFSGNGYLPPKTNCGKSLQNNHHTFDIGLRPPGPPRPSSHGKFRSARSSFNDNNIRLEYGFKPPLVPSLEIDDQGNPIEKEEK